LAIKLCAIELGKCHYNTRVFVAAGAVVRPLVWLAAEAFAGECQGDPERHRGIGHQDQGVA